MAESTPPATKTVVPLAPAGARPARPLEIKLISHSPLFYWWPVWFLAFTMALWTYVENHRLAIVPAGATVAAGDNGKYVVDVGARPATRSLADAVNNSTPGSTVDPFRARVSQHAALGAIFVVGLILTIFITNVPLRGLWSFLSIMVLVVLGLIITLVPSGWDAVFERLAGLHIYINMAGYLFIGTAVFVLWALATFVFDQRTYVIFTPGQIKVCEHIGASVEAFGTFNVRLEKQRDDLFRHYILGFGSGDLILHVANGRDIRMPNILGIGWRLQPVEDLLRTTAVSS